jgi:hypothetical protein
MPRLMARSARVALRIPLATPAAGRERDGKQAARSPCEELLPMERDPRVPSTVTDCMELGAVRHLLRPRLCRRFAPHPAGKMRPTPTAANDHKESAGDSRAQNDRRNSGNE